MFKYIGIPYLHARYQVPCIDGAKAMLAFIPLGPKERLSCGLIRDTFLHNAAMLLSVPRKYLDIHQKK
jgi:hypothetical protein